jgi:hypothetical protein
VENKKELYKSMEKPHPSAETTAQAIGDAIIAVLDRLGGTKSDVKLSFEDLTLDTGMFKARINGAVVLDIVYAQEAEPK